MLSSGSNPALSSYERDLNREIFSVYLTVNMEDNFKKSDFCAYPDHLLRKFRLT